MVQTKLININDISQGEYELEYTKLCEQKRSRVERLRFEDDKKRALAANLAARCAVSDFLKVDANEVKVTYDSYGKPVCDGCYISLSHSGDLAVCAVSSSPVGVDIEMLRSDINPNLSDKICKNLSELTFACDAERLVELWSIKEACFKALSPSCKTVSEVELTVENSTFSCNGISHIETEILYEKYIFSLALV